MNEGRLHQDEVDRVAERLQRLYDSLPDDEKPVLRMLVHQAAGESEVSGFTRRNWIAFHQLGSVDGGGGDSGNVSVNIPDTRTDPPLGGDDLVLHMNLGFF